MGKRVIKFRVWENRQNTMYSHKDVDDLDKEGLILWGEIFNGTETDVEIMQFTGIYDKNGKEIYEGDLLEIPVNEAIREGVHRIYYFKDGFVSSSIFFKEDETANKSSLTWIINRGAFVIGNIFENPELLTNEQTD